MNTPPTAPSPGKPVSAGFFSRLIGWIRSGQLVEGQGYKLHRTPNGTSIEIKAARRAASKPENHPWKVFVVGKSQDVDHLFEIYIPEGVLHIGEVAVEIEEISAVSGKDGRYTFDFENDIGEDKVVNLVITRDDGGFKARLSLETESEDEEDEEDEDIFTILPIARLAVDDSGEYPRGMVKSQYAHSSICLSGGNGGLPGRFEITLVEDEPTEGSDATPTYSATFANPYYDIGGKTYEMPSPPALVGIKVDSIIVLKLSAKKTPTAELAFVLSLQELQQQQENTDHYTIPLYKVDGGKVVCDFRTGPISGMGEF